MDSTTTEVLDRCFKRAENELLIALEIKDVPFANIEHLLSSYRSACENVIFHDFALVPSKDAQSRVWDIHTKINTRFRKELLHCNQGEGQKKTVNRRKIEKHYLEFIKSSVRFYRGFIQRLASQFSNVEEVLEVAWKFNLETRSAEDSIMTDITQREEILGSCHESLVRLGDLSRYRETELQSKNRDWGPAKGYYNLAIKMMPASGAPYNQLAVIAQRDQDPLRAIYYLYRAMLARLPYPAASENLEREFRKIRDRWNKQDPPKQTSNDSPYASFQVRFAAFQAKCSLGAEFEERNDLETDLIYEFAEDMVPNAEPSLLFKICIISIASEAAATASFEAFQFFQSFNVKLLCQLLHGLVSNLRHVGLSKPTATPDIPSQSSEEALKPAVRRLLPILRLYTSWLWKELNSLVSLVNSDHPLTAAVLALWEVYTEALTVLQSTISQKPLLALGYLLPEDGDVVAFKPLDNTVAFIYRDGSGGLKMADPSTKRQSPGEEMLHRIKDLIMSGIAMTKLPEKEPKPPIVYSGGRFTYQIFQTPRKSSHTTTQTSTGDTSLGLQESQYTIPSQIFSPSDFHNAAMRQMVDNIVDDPPKNPRSSQRRPLSISSTLLFPQDENTRPNDTPFTAVDLVRQMQRSPHPHSPSPVNLPSLPSAFPTAFTPQLGDTISSRPGSAHAGGFPFTATMAGPTYPSSAAFRNDILQQQQALQMRSSPQQSLREPSSWFDGYNTPTGMRSMVCPPQSPSSWVSPNSPKGFGGEEVKNSASQRALFGAIGDTPGRTPTSAQPG